MVDRQIDAMLYCRKRSSRQALTTCGRADMARSQSGDFEDIITCHSEPKYGDDDAFCCL
jgi:hypothetical protein